MKFKIILLTALLLAPISPVKAQLSNAQICAYLLEFGDSRKLIIEKGNEAEVVELDELISKLDPVDQKLANNFYPSKEQYLTEPELRLHWQASYPEYIKKDESGKPVIMASKKNYLRYIAPDLYWGVVKQLESGRDARFRALFRHFLSYKFIIFDLNLIFIENYSKFKKFL